MKMVMLPHYVGEDVVEGEKREQTQVSHGKSDKCFVELNYDNYIKNKRVCRRCYNESRRKNRVA